MNLLGQWCAANVSFDQPCLRNGFSLATWLQICFPEGHFSGSQIIPRAMAAQGIMLSCPQPQKPCAAVDDTCSQVFKIMNLAKPHVWCILWFDSCDAVAPFIPLLAPSTLQETPRKRRPEQPILARPQPPCCGFLWNISIFKNYIGCWSRMSGQWTQGWRGRPVCSAKSRFLKSHARFQIYRHRVLESQLGKNIIRIIQKLDEQNIVNKNI